MELGRNIKRMRKEKGLRQEQLAEVMGVSTAAVSKWETGQAAPELTVLMELANFFEVSIDALMGHKLTGHRKEDLLDEMKQQEEANDFARAAETAEKLLRLYPNDPVIVEKAADLYYKIFIRTSEKSAMERAIALTKQLFVVQPDPTGTNRFDLLSSLGNQYALLSEWDTARKYYTEGNVGGKNDRELAWLMADEGKSQEALTAGSKVFGRNLFNIVMDAIKIANCWESLGEIQKAEAAFSWAISTLNGVGGEAAAHYRSIKATIYFSLAVKAEEQGKQDKADENIRNAMLTVQGRDSREDTMDFFAEGTAPNLVSSGSVSPEGLLALLNQLGAARLYAVAEKLL